MSRRAISVVISVDPDAGGAEELLDEPALALVGHRLADDLARGEQGEVGDLGADLLDGAGLLGLDLGGGPDAQALELLAGRGDVRVTRLLGDLLGAGQDLVRLATSLGERGDALLSPRSPDRAGPARRP